MKIKEAVLTGRSYLQTLAGLGGGYKMAVNTFKKIYVKVDFLKALSLVLEGH